MGSFASADHWLKDLRYAGRSLGRNPGFAGVAVLLLALGIGAATAIFTIADQALLRLLPVTEPAQLKLLKWDGQFIGGSTRGWADNFSYPLFREVEETESEAVDGTAARFQETAAVDIGSGVGRAEVELVSGGYFQVLGVDAVLGRTLLPEDDEDRDAEPWVVLAYDYWRSRFGADASVLGRTIRINGYPFTVIGVSQPGFHGFEALRPASLFVPLQMKAVVTPTWDDRDRRDSIWLNVFVRLASGADASEAEAALMVPYSGALRRDLQAHSRNTDFAERYLRNRLELVAAAKGLGELREYVATPLHVLLGMVGVLILITCVNVANLLFIRSAKREREIAVRSSLGASRFAMIRLVLVECLLLAAAGGVLGLLLARVAAELLARMIPADRFGLAFETAPDWRILAFTAALALLTALLFGLAPAFQASGGAAAHSLKSEGPSVSLGRHQARVRRTLVVAQVALSLTLLAIAGLFGKSLNNIFEVDSGLAVDRLLAFSINPSEQRYEPEQAHRLALELQRRLNLLPGVVSVAAASYPVLTNARWQNTIAVEGYQSKQDENMQAGENYVSSEFFSTMGIGLLAGRDFTERDASGSPEVAIVNETFVRRFFDSPAAAVGRRIGFGSDTQRFEIIGVVEDHKASDLKEELWPRTYWPLLQRDDAGHIALYLHTRGEPESLTGAALQIVRDIDAGLAVYGVKTVERQIEETHYVERLVARLSAAFAALATLIAAVGLYGVAAFSVARRTREIGVRIALGAQHGGIFKMVLAEALGLAFVGVLLGIPLALAIGKLAGSQLYGVAAIDPGVSIAAVGVLMAAAALAGYLPARRAARISPISALRYE